MWDELCAWQGHPDVCFERTAPLLGEVVGTLHHAEQPAEG